MAGETVSHEEYPYYFQCHHCGDAAFYLDGKPDPADKISAAHAIHTDGHAIDSNDPISCDACGKLFSKSTMSLQYVLIRPEPGQEPF